MELGARTGDVQPLVEGSDHTRSDTFARELAIVVERLQENLLLRSEHPGHRLQQAHPRGSLVSCPDGGRMRHAGRARTRGGRSKRRAGAFYCPGHRTFLATSARCRHIVALWFVALGGPRNRPARLLGSGLHLWLGLAHCQKGWSQAVTLAPSRSAEDGDRPGGNSARRVSACGVEDGVDGGWLEDKAGRE
jgi:hypothetical protein